MKLKTIIATLFAISAFAAISAYSNDNDTTLGGDATKFEAKLSGIASGKAKYKTKLEDAGFQTEMEVEGEDLRPNTDYYVIIGFDQLWTVHTDAFGSFEINNRNDDRIMLPIKDGTQVLVNDTSGITMMSGVFIKI